MRRLVGVRALLVPNISRVVENVKMVLYELPKRKSFLLTIVLFSADCKSAFRVDRFQETAARQMFFIEFMFNRLVPLVIEERSDACPRRRW